MTEWEQDKRWSDKFLSEIKRIIGEHIIVESPYEEDAEHNTDLMVLGLNAVRVACRIRRHGYLKEYGNEFTIRTSRPKGTKTELEKIIEGWGDYILYGFANREETFLEKWILGDLASFRVWFVKSICNNSGIVPGIKKTNTDKSSGFRSFEYAKIPGFVIASGGLSKLSQISVKAPTV